MPRRKFGEGIGIPAEDLGYQFLVGLGAQSPPCPATRREAQHNCLLIRIIAASVTGIFARFAPRRLASGARNAAHTYHDNIDLFDDFRWWRLENIHDLAGAHWRRSRPRMSLLAYRRFHYECFAANHPPKNGSPMASLRDSIIRVSQHTYFLELKHLRFQILFFAGLVLVPLSCGLGWPTRLQL